MKRFLLIGFASLLACAAWGAVVFAALDGGWGHRVIADDGDVRGFLAAAREMAEEQSVGNLGLILIEDGEETGSFFVSQGEPIGPDSVFQVASLGKWLTAWGVMVLVEEGSIELDAPVSTYLTRWDVPPSDFDASGVTVRRLLSHTSGLVDGLGYDGFDSPDQRESLEESLTRAGDAAPGNSGQVRLGAEPGSGWDYSGGGYTLLQLVVEEVSGSSFPEFMHERVFEPLGMQNTTFDHETAAARGLAQNFRPDGEPEPFRWYTALAATSLFTTPADMARFIEVQSPGGSQPVLDDETIELIRTPHASSMGADIWGLGAMLYAPNNADGFVIGHDGSNRPAINTAARLDPATGDGIVILSTGNPLLATELAGEWVFWKTGNVDTLTFTARLPNALLWFALGCVLIIGTALFLGLRGRLRRKRPRVGDRVEHALRRTPKDVE